MTWKIVVAVVAFLAGGTWFGVAIAGKVSARVARQDAVRADAEQKAEAASRPVPPALVSPEPAALDATLRVTGTLEPDAAIDIGFKVPGRVAEVRVRRGDVVTAGHVLARLETRDLAAQEAQARAAVQVAKAQKELAADTLARTARLEEAGAGTGIQVALARGQTRVSAAAISQARAALDALDALRAEIEIVAPFDGVVVSAPSSAGFVASPGVPIVRIERLSTLRFTGHVAQKDAVRVRAKQVLKVTSETGETGSGEVTLVLGSLDPVTRRVPVEGTIANAGGRLFAGSFVVATIAADPPGWATGLLQVPMTAVLTGDTPNVLVAGRGGVLERRAVDVAATREGRIFVTRGLARSDRIVADPGTAWREGDTLPAAP